MPTLGRRDDAGAHELQENAGGLAAAQPGATNDPALPGFERAVAEQRDAAAAERGHELTKDLNHPQGDIEKTAGETERNSPLFEGSAAVNPQKGPVRTHARRLGSSLPDQ